MCRIYTCITYVVCLFVFLYTPDTPHVYYRCVNYTWHTTRVLQVCELHLIHHTCITGVWITPDTPHVHYRCVWITPDTPHVYYRCVNYTWHTTRVLQVCELHLIHHTCITGVWITPDTPHLYYIAKYGPVFEINIIKGKSLSSLRALAGGWKINSDFHILVMWRSIFYLSYAARWKR